MGKFRKMMLGATTALAAMTVSAPAHALKIILNDVGGVTGSQAERGFRAAASFWESVITNNATVKLDVRYATLGTGILGSTGSSRAIISTTNSYNALAAVGNSALDAIAVANLRPLGPSVFGPGYGAVTATTNAYLDPVAKTGVNYGATTVDADGSQNNATLWMNTSVARGLGITTDEFGNALAASDGSVTFSNTFAFDFNPTNGISDGQFDFIGVAIHEIGHALGFVSGVDLIDANRTFFNTRDFGGFTLNSTLDLFRYSAPGVLNWATGGTPYFSIDGGATQLFGDSRFSTGRNFGDGQQASHWKDNTYAPRVNPLCSNPVTTPIGLMNPTIGACESGVITALDLAAFDAMGWNLNFDVLANSNYTFSSAQAFAGVPEPETWAMMIVGFGLVGGAYRRRRTSVAFQTA